MSVAQRATDPNMTDRSCLARSPLERSRSASCGAHAGTMKTMPPLSPFARVRAMPWVLVFELALTLRKHWKRLPPAERRQLTELIRKSQGVPTRLSGSERADVRRLVAKLEPVVIARSVVPIGRRAVKGRRR